MILRRAPLAAAAAAGIALLASSTAWAQSVKLLGDFRDWSSYAASEGADALCFAMSKPVDVSPIPDGYTQAFLYLTHRPSESVDNELNLVAGYTFAPDTPATLSVGDQSFQLFTQGDSAWLDNAAQSDTLAGVMRAGTTLVVEGTSEKGIKISETFSLSGATAASKAINGGC